MERAERQRALSVFHFQTPILVTRLCQEQGLLGGAARGGRWSWVTQRMNHRSSYKHRKRPRSFPPHSLDSFHHFCCPQPRQPMEEADTGILHGSVVVNQLKHRRQYFVTGYLQNIKRDRVPPWLTESAVEMEGKKLGDSGVHVFLSQKMASNSPMAIWLILPPWKMRAQSRGVWVTHNYFQMLLYWRKNKVPGTLGMWLKEERQEPDLREPAPFSGLRITSQVYNIKSC